MDIEIPQYNSDALGPYADLMQSAQDINIYVEDPSLKYVYNELIEHLDLHGLKFVSVMPLSGRKDVIEHAESHSSNKPTCYFVDGDLYFADNKHGHPDCRVYVHECYCFENYFIDEKLCCEEIHDELGNCSRNSIMEKLNWEYFIQEIRDYLVPLFEEYALAFSLGYLTKLTNRGIGCVIDEMDGCQRISPKKITDLINEIDDNLKSSFANEEIELKRKEIHDNVQRMSAPWMIVSGKDYLIPYMVSLMKRLGCKRIKKGPGLLMRLLKKWPDAKYVFFQSAIDEQIEKAPARASWDNR